MSSSTETELKQRIEELNNASSAARHDLNNMLFVISGYAHLLKSEVQSKAALEQLEAIEDSVEKSKQIMADWKNEATRRLPSDNTEL